MRESYSNDKLIQYLELAFANCKGTFFPRWDRTAAWRPRLGSYSGSPNECGYCDSDAKTIWIAPHVLRDDVQLELVIVHEVCHAIANNGSHRGRWAKRMDMAARRAAQMGRDAFAKAIREELELWSTAHIIRAREVCSDLEDMVLQRPEASFDSLCKALARELGMPVDDLVSRYRRPAFVHQRALRFME